MNLTQRCTDVLNAQMNTERYNNAVYMALAGQFDVMNLVGMAKFMKKQACGEMEHSKKIYEYIVDRNAAPAIGVVPVPAVPVVANPQDAFVTALNLERTTTQQISNLYETAVAERDYLTVEFLMWFLNEQVEEERILSEILGRLAIGGNDGSSILLIDHWLGEGA